MKFFTLILLTLLFSCSRSHKVETTDLKIGINPIESNSENAMLAGTFAVEPSSISQIDCIAAMVGLKQQPIDGVGNRGFCYRNDGIPLPVSRTGGLVPFTGTVGAGGTGAVISVPDVRIETPLKVFLVGYNSNGYGCVPLDPNFSPNTLGYSKGYILGVRNDLVIGAGKDQEFGISAKLDVNTNTIASCDPTVVGDVGSGNVFDPNSIGGLKFWMDATDSSSFTVNSNHELLNISDKTGNHTLTLSGDIGKIVETNWSGAGSNNSFQFTGSANAQYILTDMPALTTTTIFIVFKMNSAIQGTLFGAWENTQGANINIADSSGTMYLNTDYLGSMTGTTQLITGTPYLALFQTDGSSSSKLRLNKNLDASTTPSGSVTTCSYGIGALISKSSNCGDSISNQFNGKIGEILVYENVLSAIDRGKIETYLVEKWSN